MLLCAAMLFAVQDPMNVRVTFTSAGEPVPKLIEHLSQAAHVSLLAPKAFQSDILAIRVKDASLQTLLSKISDLTAGDWHRSPDGYTLTRDSAKVHAEEQAEFIDQVAMFQKAIDRDKKKLATLEKWDDGTAKTIAIGLNEANQAVNRQAGQSLFPADA